MTWDQVKSFIDIQSGCLYGLATPF